jgi:hypothetical protein
MFNKIFIFLAALMSNDETEVHHQQHKNMCVYSPEEEIIIVYIE